MSRLIAVAALCAVVLTVGIGCAKKTAQTNTAPSNKVSASSGQPTTDGNAPASVNTPSGGSEKDKSAPKDGGTNPTKKPAQTPSDTTKNGQENPKKQLPPTKAALLPRIVDLGRGTCIPCKQMAPILAELQTELKGKATVEVIDLRDDPDAADKYKIRLIPTQIFFNTDGKEISRHEGFMPRADIIATLKEAGMKA